MTNVIFSPDEKLILTGLSGPDVPGILVMIDAETFKPVHKLGLSAAGIIRVKWQTRINQIACSTSDGKVKILYDEKKSQRGAKFCVSKAPRKADVLDSLGVASFADITGTIFTPHLHESFQDQDSAQAVRGGASMKSRRNDPKKTRLPERPLPNDNSFALGPCPFPNRISPVCATFMFYVTTVPICRLKSPTVIPVRLIEGCHDQSNLSVVDIEKQKTKQKILTRWPDHFVRFLFLLTGRQGIVRDYAINMGMHIAQHTSFNNTRDEDPREAILKFAEECEKNPQFVNNAYSMYNQPTEPIFDTEYSSDDEEPLTKVRKFDPVNKPFTSKKGRGLKD